MKKCMLILGFGLLFFGSVFSQSPDTISIDASDINTKALIPGTHRYLVYFKMGKDSSRTKYQLWSRTIEFIEYNGKEAISVKQEWEDNDTIMHTAKTILDKKTFATWYHENWWKGRGSSTFDFESKVATSDGISLRDKKDSLSIRQLKAFDAATPQYFLNWHLDLEVFSILPYKEGVTFKINFYDPGNPAPRYEAYSVIGSATLTGYNNQKIDCWLLKHGSLPRNQEIFYISKATKEVLKLEQEFAVGRARYKILLGYSN